MFESLGDEHANHDSRMAHYKDLRDLYAKSLEYHGIGYALFQPISANDMIPPCAGFFDRNGDFNMIARLATELQDDGLQPLEYMPPKVSDVGITWKPKTSLGVTALSLDASGEGPQNVPASADAHVKYQSESSFGAVLIAARPVTLTGYNDERLFLNWLEANRAQLLEKHGRQLRKYGMWIVTRTHTAPGCWINAWQSKNREALLSVKVKANMLAAAGNEVEMDDSTSDRDWTCYRAKDDKGVVVFMDGIEVTASQWYLESVKQTFSGGLSRSSSRRSSSQARASPPTVTLADPYDQTYLRPSPGRYQQASEPDYMTAAVPALPSHRRSHSQASRMSYASSHTPRRNSNSPTLSELSDRRRSSYSPAASSPYRHSIGGTPLDDGMATLGLSSPSPEILPASRPGSYLDAPASTSPRPRTKRPSSSRPVSYAGPPISHSPFPASYSPRPSARRQPTSFLASTSPPPPDATPGPRKTQPPPQTATPPAGPPATSAPRPSQPLPATPTQKPAPPPTAPSAAPSTPAAQAGPSPPVAPADAIWDATAPDADHDGLPDSFESEIDDQLLKDIGLAGTIARQTIGTAAGVSPTPSIAPPPAPAAAKKDASDPPGLDLSDARSRSASLSQSLGTISRASSPRTPSLRREVRRVSGQKA